MSQLGSKTFNESDMFFLIQSFTIFFEKMMQLFSPEENAIAKNQWILFKQKLVDKQATTSQVFAFANNIKIQVPVKEINTQQQQQQQILSQQSPSIPHRPSFTSQNQGQNSASSKSPQKGYNQSQQQYSLNNSSNNNIINNNKQQFTPQQHTRKEEHNKNLYTPQLEKYSQNSTNNLGNSGVKQMLGDSHKHSSSISVHSKQSITEIQQRPSFIVEQQQQQQQQLPMYNSASNSRISQTFEKPNKNDFSTKAITVDLNKIDKEISQQKKLEKDQKKQDFLNTIPKLQTQKVKTETNFNQEPSSTLVESSSKKNNNLLNIEREAKFERVQSRRTSKRLQKQRSLSIDQTKTKLALYEYDIQDENNVQKQLKMQEEGNGGYQKRLNELKTKSPKGSIEYDYEQEDVIERIKPYDFLQHKKGNNNNNLDIGDQNLTHQEEQQLRIENEKLAMQQKQNSQNKDKQNTNLPQQAQQHIPIQVNQKTLSSLKQKKPTFSAQKKDELFKMVKQGIEIIKKNQLTLDLVYDRSFEIDTTKNVQPMMSREIPGQSRFGQQQQKYQVQGHQYQNKGNQLNKKSSMMKKLSVFIKNDDPYQHQQQQQQQVQTQPQQKYQQQTYQHSQQSQQQQQYQPQQQHKQYQPSSYQNNQQYSQNKYIPSTTTQTNKLPQTTTTTTTGAYSIQRNQQQSIPQTYKYQPSTTTTTTQQQSSQQQPNSLLKKLEQVYSNPQQYLKTQYQQKGYHGQGGRVII